MIKIIPISKRPNHIILTVFDKTNYHYHLNDLSTKNKICDVGVWNIKYKANER